jgi:hypothetical protein
VADNFNSDDMFRFLDELKQNLGKSGESAGDSLNDFEKAVKSATGEKGFRSLNRGLNDLEKASHSVADADIKRAAAEIKTVQAIQQISSYIRGLGSTVVSADSGVGKYGQGITTATDTIGNFTAKLGPLGAVVGEVIKMFGGLVAAGLQQNDELINNFRTIRDFGVIFNSATDGLTNGISGLLNIKNDLGGTKENLVYFGSVLKNIAPDLAGFGGSISQGATNFAKVTGQLFEEVNLLDLNNLGYTQQDIIKFGSQFISNQTKYGKIESTNIADTTKRTKQYLETLSELNQLTGMSRDEAAKKMQEQQAALEFQLYLRDKGKTEADAARANMALVQELFGPTASAAFMKLVANQGVATDELTATYARLFNGIIPDFESTMKEGGGGILQFANLMRKNLSPVLEANTSAYERTARVNKELGGQLGITTDMLVGSNRLRNLENIDMIKKAKLEEDLRSNDERIQKAARIELDQMKARREKNIAADKYVVESMTVISKFIQILDQASWGLAKFLKFITFGQVDFTDAWRTINSMEEATSILDEELANQTKLKEEETKLQTEYNKQIEEKIKFEKEHADKKLWGTSNGYTEEIKDINENISSARAALRDNKLAQGRSKLVEQKANEYKIEHQLTSADDGKQKSNSNVSSANLNSSILKPGALDSKTPLNSELVAITKTLPNTLKELGYNIKQVTSLTGGDHNSGSKHGKGQAMDFTVSKDGKDISSRDADNLIKLLKIKYPNLSIKNEIDKPTGKETKWSGAHLHSELINPTSTSTITPKDSGATLYQSSPANKISPEQINHINSLIEETKKKNASESNNKTLIPEKRAEIDVNFYDEMVAQFTDMNDKLSRIHNIQEQQLNYAKA